MIAKFSTINDYVKNNVDPNQIEFFWIDTEGFEDAVLRGAVETLDSSVANMYLEFNVETYKEHGTFSSVCSNLRKFYSEFIVYEEYEKTGE